MLKLKLWAIAGAIILGGLVIMLPQNVSADLITSLNLRTPQIPEPVIMLLLGVGLLSVAGLSRRMLKS